MPCDCGYMEATWAEREVSRVACLIDQLKGKKKINQSHWDGYHPRVYSQVGIVAEDIKKELYDMIMKRNRPITEYSLEVQVFYRDYVREIEKKKKDKERRERERLQREKDRREKEKVLSKLTPQERKILGV